MSIVCLYDNLQIDMVHILEFHKEPVYDERDNYCFTKVRLVVQGVYNHATESSYRIVNRNPRQFPEPPAVTEVALRHKLLQPRKTVWLRIGNDDLLLSPKQDAISDALNGPTPILCDVVQVIGTKTFIVRWGVETTISEQELFNVTVPFLVSNTWSMTFETSEDYFQTRTCRGRAQFRMDEIPVNLFQGGAQQRTFPDDYLQYLLPPQISGFKRVHTESTAMPDGTAIEWSTVDEQQYANIRVRGVSRIEAYQTANVVRGDFFEATGSALGIASTIASLFTPVRGGAAAQQYARHPAVRTARGASTTASIMSASRNLFPHRSASIVVEVWGNPGVYRNTLLFAGLDIISSRLARFTAGPTGAVNGLYGLQIAVTQDLMRPYVMLTAQVESGLLRQAFEFRVAGVRNTFVNTLDLNPYDVDSHILGNGSVQVTPTTFPSPFPAVDGVHVPPEDSGARGFFLNRAFAQALRSETENVHAWPNDASQRRQANVPDPTA